MRRQFLKPLLALAAASLLAPALVQAEPKPIRLVLGQAAGGAVDTVARALAEALSQELGQPVVVDNRPGAGGMLAAELLANAPADGHTLGLLDVGSVVVNPLLQKTVRYDVSKDFAPLGSVARIPLAMVAHPSLPVASLRELTQLAKAQPDKLSYASSGVGSPPQFTFENYKRQAGVAISHVPYRGGAPALADVVAGHILLTVVDTNLASQYLKDGRIKVLAVATAQRSPLMPQVPTFAEAGYQMSDFVPWVGVLAPRKTPAATLQRLEDKLQHVTASTAFAARMAAIGFDAAPGSGTALAQLVQADRQRYGALIRSQGIQLDDSAR
ncbi:tripartite tricarboxylate transporter substrate binding protein [Comamonas humi]